MQLGFSLIYTAQ